VKSIPRRHDEPLGTSAEPQRADPMRTSAVPAVPAPTPIENNRTIEIDRFVPREQIDAHYLDTRS
jgi:hypothetical protein